MCEQCVEIDQTIERYRRITRSINDNLTLERAEELIADLEARKIELHPDRTPSGRLSWRPLSFSSGLFRPVPGGHI